MVVLMARGVLRPKWKGLKPMHEIERAKLKMKWIPLAIVMCGAVLIAGCATNRGSYCDVAKVIRPSVNDTMTEETKRQILRENEKLAKLCGVAA